MNSKLIALASAATIAVAAVAIPNQAEARWRGGGWWVPGAVVGGLALGAAIASRPYYYGPGYYGLMPTATVVVPTITAVHAITRDRTDIGQSSNRLTNDVPPTKPRAMSRGFL
jgi:hypothetical protein